MRGDAKRPSPIAAMREGFTLAKLAEALRGMPREATLLHRSPAWAASGRMKPGRGPSTMQGHPSCHSKRMPLGAIIEPDPCSGSYDADVFRASELQHSVQHVGCDGYLGRPTLVRLRTQPIADDALPARDIALHESAPAVPGGLLPAHAAALGNASQMPVALRRCDLGGVARHRIRARRHDHGC